MALGPGQNQSVAHPQGLQHHLAPGIRQGHGADEASGAVGGVAEFVQQAMDALVIGGGIAGGVDARGAAEGIHLQARIVGQGPAAGEGGDGFSFQARIGRVGATGFLHFDTAGLLAHIHRRAFKHGADFRHLVGIATGDHQHGH